MSISKEITALRKGGKIDEAERLCLAELEKNFDDRYLQNAYGWVIYSRLKNASENVDSKKISSLTAESILNRYATEYAKLDLVSKPDLLHSMILTQVLKIDKDWSRFLGFARWWGENNFRIEDYKPFQSKGGKNIASLAQRYFYRIGHALTKHYSKNKSDDLSWGREQLEAALQQTPGDQWLNFYKSKLLLLEGNYDSARKSLIPVIRQQKKAFWVWSLLGDILSKINNQKAIICYQYAISLSQRPIQVVNVHEKLAKILSIEQRYPEAKVQVNKALEARKKAGTKKIPESLSQLLKAEWYQQQYTEEFHSEKNISQLADEILFENLDLNYRLGVVDNQNVEKNIVHISFTLKEGVVLYYKKFPGISNLKIGTVIKVAFEEGKFSPVRWEESDEQVVPNFYQKFKGVLKKPSTKEFGFIRTDKDEQIFVPPYLMKMDCCVIGSIVRCQAIKSIDKKKGKEGWQALIVESNSID